MIDSDIQLKIDLIKDHVSKINELMAMLEEKNVEIRIQFKDSTNSGSNTKPHLELWRATEHINYLKENK